MSVVRSFEFRVRPETSPQQNEHGSRLRIVQAVNADVDSNDAYSLFQRGLLVPAAATAVVVTRASLSRLHDRQRRF
jgi:hypothetical protein